MKRTISEIMTVVVMLMFSFSMLAVTTRDNKEKYSNTHNEISIQTRIDNEVNSLGVIKDGHLLIDTFYKYLLSDCNLEECPAIFCCGLSEYDTNLSPEELKNIPISKQKKKIVRFLWKIYMERRNKEFLKQEWRYLRQNKKLFLPMDCNDVSYDNVYDFYRKSDAKWGYFFFNQPDVEHISKARLVDIVLQIRSGIRDRSGIDKLIFFPIIKSDITNSYKIFSMKINGVCVGNKYDGEEDIYSTYFDREFDLFKWLGFNAEEEVPYGIRENYPQNREECKESKLEGPAERENRGWDFPHEKTCENDERSGMNAIQALKEGDKLVETFYTYLFSECDASECPDIFTGCLSSLEKNKDKKKELLSQEWSCLRKNKRLFVTLECDYSIPRDASKFCHDLPPKKGYYFFDPPDIEHITEAKEVYIVFRTGLGIRALDGVFKFIFIPITKDKQTNTYKINLEKLNVNGVKLGIEYSGKYKIYSKHFDRNFNLFEYLGFNLNIEIPEFAKERIRHEREDCNKRKTK